MISFEKFKNKKIAILGYGKEGKSSLHFLIKIGVLPRDITILDGAKKIEGLAESFEYIHQTFAISPDFNVVLGETYLDTLKRFDLIIKTPGVSIYHEKIYPYRHKITSQAQIFFDYYQGKIIAVSGTKGKSTTSTIIYETLKNAKKNVQLVGNIGNPVLNYLDSQNLESQKKEYTVFEVSSYMLEGLKKKNYISVLLNIYADHIDWHAGFENYKDAKINLLNGSKYNMLRDEIVKKQKFKKQELNDMHVRIFGHTGNYTYQEGIFYADKKNIFTDDSIVLKGEHNMMNISAVVGICDIMNINYKILEKTLATFIGLPHRMENIGIYGGITWIDDAISTTPESTIQAIQTFGKKIDTIFLGGTDRGYVFDELIKTIIEYGIRNVVLFPDSGKRIFNAIKGKDAGEIKIFQTDDMKEAVKFAYKYTENGKMVLLSTASPSYSIRKNFEEKGNLFKKHIKELI
ncbi:MAG: UDP-N-acetylmuramoyl-L-alanine--D-glutamate ligase [candidate division SR1 bacterium]|nr:UDP-N-acetylmuramoyl-L-alanine--D-glutamate ligase [candidate division SR1 bacterium]